MSKTKFRARCGLGRLSFTLRPRREFGPNGAQGRRRSYAQTEGFILSLSTSLETSFEGLVLSLVEGFILSVVEGRRTTPSPQV